MTQPVSKPDFWASSLATLVNLALSAGVGYWLFGPIGALAGAGVLLAAFITQRWLRPKLSAAHPDDRLASAVLLIGKIIVAPFALAYAAVVLVFGGVIYAGAALVSRIADFFGGFGMALPQRRKTAPAKAPVRREWDGDNIAMLLANVVLLILIGCLWYGMEVAFYAALIATPIWLAVLVFVAIHAAEPDVPADVGAEGDGH